MLRAFAELVLNVVSTLRMRPSRLPAECHTDVPPAALPGETNDTQKETQAVPQDSRQALMLSSTQSVRPSKHARGLTVMSHTSPPPSVSLTTSAIHLPLHRIALRSGHFEIARSHGDRVGRWRQTRLRGIASTAFGGGGGLRALARMTEGALRPTPNKNAAA